MNAVCFGWGDFFISKCQFYNKISLLCWRYKFRWHLRGVAGVCALVGVLSGVFVTARALHATYNSSQALSACPIRRQHAQLPCPTALPYFSVRATVVLLRRSLPGCPDVFLRTAFGLI